MKRFTFPLERVRLWRKSQIDIEYAKLQRLFDEMRILEASVASLHSTVEEARAPIQIAAAAGNPLDAGELTRLDDYQLFARHQVGVFARKKQQILERITAQRARLVEARRNFSLLDKLKERAQEKWQAEHDKELEDLASELFLAKWNRG